MTPLAKKETKKQKQRRRKSPPQKKEVGKLDISIFLIHAFLSCLEVVVLCLFLFFVLLLFGGGVSELYLLDVHFFRCLLYLSLIHI